MVWGCFTTFVTGHLAVIDSTLKSASHQRVLVCLKVQVEVQKWTFQKHNDPKHTQKYTKERLKKEKRRRTVDILVERESLLTVKALGIT